MATETPEYAAFCRRVIRAYARRVAAADEVDLGDMIQVRDEMDAAIQAAIDGMRDRGRSWSYIGKGLGTSRQAAQQTYGRRRADHTDGTKVPGNHSGDMQESRKTSRAI